MHRFIIVLSLLGPNGHGQQLPVITPAESALAGITAISEGTADRFYNPASSFSTGISFSLSGYYRGTNMFGVQAGFNHRAANLYGGLSVMTFGDQIYRHHQLAGGITLNIRKIYLGAGTIINRVTFDGILQKTSSIVKLGFQTHPESRLMGGCFIEAAIFNGRPATSYYAAFRIRIMEIAGLYVQLHNAPNRSLSYAAAGLIRIASGSAFMFGLSMPFMEPAIGFQYNIGGSTITFSLSFHPYLGTKPAAGIQHEL